MTLKDSLLLPLHSPWPVGLSSIQRDKLSQLAKSLCRDETALSVLSPFVDGMHGEPLDAPSLVIEDHSWIRLFEHSGDEAYSYRALLLAGDDDLAAIGVGRNRAFEEYCRDWLGLGAPRLLIPEETCRPMPLSVRCRLDRQFISDVVRHAEQHDGLNILPYMGTWPLWALAGEIAGHCRAPIRVIAPPAQLTRRINDKLWFARLARKVWGQNAIPPALCAHNFAGLCQLTADFARRCECVAIKLPDSASSAGNLVLHVDELQYLSLRSVFDLLKTRLDKLGWNGYFPLQVTSWEAPIIGSPSVHLWIPAEQTTAPMVEAIFDQHSSGLAREFDGARPCQLPKNWQGRLAQQAFEFASLLKRLGYVGRCSLDAIIVGNTVDDAVLHWVECNGRWGGVSLPLSLNRRLDKGMTEPMPFVIVEEAHRRGPPKKFSQALTLLDDLAYRRGEREEGVVLVSPGRLEDGSGFELMARAETLEIANELAVEAARRLS